MGHFVNIFDIQVNIFTSSSLELTTGFKSKYKDIPFPGVGKTIQGWAFDKKYWTSSKQQNDLSVEPTLWDPLISQKDTFQSGIGDTDDLLVEDIQSQYIGSGSVTDEVWSPVINHGYFYLLEDEFYLYSDDSITLYPASGQLVSSDIDITISGGSYLDYDLEPKPGIPILCRSFTWNGSFYKVADEFRKVISFTSKIQSDGSTLPTKIGDEILWENINTSVKEFIVLPDKFIFNQEVVSSVGRTLSDTTNFNNFDLQSMELVGSTTDLDLQEHHLKYAPVSRGKPVQVLLYDGISLQEYTIVESFTSALNEVKVDYDLGTLQFNSGNAKPLVGSSIYVAYWKTFALEYEPINSRDTIIDSQVDINPLTKFKADGFVFINAKLNDPASINLSADLAIIGNDFYGPLFIGNAFTKIVAQVLTSTGDIVEGQEVFFEIVSGPSSVSFGPDTISLAITNNLGLATTLFNAPGTVDQLGGATDEVITVSGLSSLFIEDYIPPTSSEDLFVFQVHTEDSILGIPKSSLLEFYEDFISQQATISGQTHGPLIDINIDSFGDYSWITGAFQDFIKWEVLHRTFNDLATPVVYDTDDLTTGKKSVIAVFDADAINPHTGGTGAFVPLQPSSSVITSSGVLLNFDQTLPDTGSTYKSYLVVGPTLAKLRAYTTNERTGQVIYSNTIDILIDIAPSSQGLVHIDLINTVPSGLLGNAYHFDQDGIDLDPVEITVSGLLPLGFRIRSSGITLASALDGITFLDINPLTYPDDRISHEFSVEV
jgi:hypothetical protein